MNGVKPFFYDTYLQSEARAAVNCEGGVGMDGGRKLGFLRTFPSPSSSRAMELVQQRMELTALQHQGHQVVRNMGTLRKQDIVVRSVDTYSFGDASSVPKYLLGTEN